MPYLENSNDNTEIIGRTSIPEDLLPGFLKHLVENYYAIVKIVNEQIKDNFDYSQFEDMISNINMNSKIR